MIGRRCPKCGGTMKIVSSPSDPFDCNPKKTYYVCSSCGYQVETNFEKMYIPLVSPELISKRLKIVGISNGLGITKKDETIVTIDELGNIVLTNRPYPLSNLGVISIEDKTMSVFDEYYPLELGKTFKITKKKPIATFDKMPAMEEDVYEFTVLESEENKND